MLIINETFVFPTLDEAYRIYFRLLDGELVIKLEVCFISTYCHIQTKFKQRNWSLSISLFSSFLMSFEISNLYYWFTIDLQSKKIKRKQAFKHIQPNISTWNMLYDYDKHSIWVIIIGRIEEINTNNMFVLLLLLSFCDYYFRKIRRFYWFIYNKKKFN